MIQLDDKINHDLISRNYTNWIGQFLVTYN